jgi:hypothetical protein
LKGKSLGPLNCEGTEEKAPQLDGSKKAASESRGPPAKETKGAEDTEDEDNGKGIDGPIKGSDNGSDWSQLIVSLPWWVDFDWQSSW